VHFGEGSDTYPGRAIGDRRFVSELGLFEFVDAATGDAKVVVRGEATRYYPLDEHEFRANRVTRFVVEVPTAPPPGSSGRYAVPRS